VIQEQDKDEAKSRMKWIVESEFEEEKPSVRLRKKNHLRNKNHLRRVTLGLRKKNHLRLRLRKKNHLRLRLRKKNHLSLFHW